MCRQKAVKLCQKVPLLPVVLSNTTLKPQRKIAFIGQTWSLHPQLLPFLLFQVLRRPVGVTGHVITIYVSDLCPMIPGARLFWWCYFFHGIFFHQRCMALKVSVNCKSEVCHFSSRIIITQTSACMHHPMHLRISRKLYLVWEAVNHTATVTTRLNQVKLELKVRYLCMHKLNEL